MRKKAISRKFLCLMATVMLAAVITVPVLASPATATRTLPASVSSGTELDVAIVTSGCGAFGQVVETLPDGFSYVSCTPSDIGVEQVGDTIKFTFLGSASFTYRAKAPTIDTTTTYTFHGVVKDEDNIEYPIGDDDTTVLVASGARTLPASVASGAELDVAIETSGCGTFGQVEDTLPDGFAYVSSSLPPDQVEQIGTMLKFTFLGDSASFTYRVNTPTLDTTTSYTFHGVVKDENRISYAIEDDAISVIAFDTGDLTNVELAGADSTVTGISIYSYPTEDLTNVPPDLDPQSACVVESSGTGSFTLRFTNIANASNMVGYKVTDSSWTELEDVTISENAVELSMEVGDPVVVFATPAAPPAIGGDAYFPNTLGLLAPWVALAVVIVGGITWFLFRRRSA
jgi:hypothetical protein